MTAIGLALGGDSTPMTVLDAVGEILEESSLRSTESGFRQRFASLPPSLIAVEYDHRNAHLLAQLSAMGHSLLLVADVPGYLRPALLPALARFARQEQRYGEPPCSVILRSPDPQLRSGFWVNVSQGEPAIDSSWFFIGPIPPGAELSHPMLAGFQAVSSLSSTTLAQRLQILASTGELPLPLYKQEVAA